MTTLAVIASSVDRWAPSFAISNELKCSKSKNFFSEGQKGSSAMPHKRNPITSERLSGLARVVRGKFAWSRWKMSRFGTNAISVTPARSESSPDSCILLDYMLVKLREIVEKLQVYPERMRQNLELTKGLYFSQSILLALTRAGAERKSAYEAVQRAAMKTWQGRGDIR
jgi:adenylosuccinate lyase